MKGSNILKKAFSGDGYWATIKEILVQGTLAMSSKQCLDLISLLDIPDSQRHISVNNRELLINNIQSMHLAVPGAIGHFYMMQVALTYA